MMQTLPNPDFEVPYWKDSLLVVGVDEAGRGPLAGPVVSASVVFPPHYTNVHGIADSKTLTETQRERLYDLIIHDSLHYAVAEADNYCIDSVNIREATLLSMQKCVSMLPFLSYHILVDGNYFFHESIPFTTVVKGDSQSVSIAAASILAKVSRDRWMKQIAHPKYPVYGFDRHKGYATSQHRSALKQFGSCEYHRRSFLKNFQ